MGSDFRHRLYHPAYLLYDYVWVSHHSDAAAIATGVKVGNPNLSKKANPGDGDVVHYYGNHFIHAIRRNVNVNIVLLNNQIYGTYQRTIFTLLHRGFCIQIITLRNGNPFRPN